MTKASIQEMVLDFKLGKTITKIAKDSKFCFRRVRKLFEHLKTLKDFDYHVGIDDVHLNKGYKFINQNYLLMEEINERQIKLLRVLVHKVGINKNAKILT